MAIIPHTLHTIHVLNFFWQIVCMRVVFVKQLQVFMEFNAKDHVVDRGEIICA